MAGGGGEPRSPAGAGVRRYRSEEGQMRKILLLVGLEVARRVLKKVLRV